MKLACFRMLQNRAIAEIRMRPLHVPYPFLSLTGIQQPTHSVPPAPTIFPNHYTNEQWNRYYMHFYRQMMLAQISADAQVDYCYLLTSRLISVSKDCCLSHLIISYDMIWYGLMNTGNQRKVNENDISKMITAK